MSCLPGFRWLVSVNWAASGNRINSLLKGTGLPFANQGKSWSRALAPIQNLPFALSSRAGVSGF